MSRESLVSGRDVGGIMGGRRKDGSGRGSGLAMESIAEGMEVPFEMWLSALPFIEGRVGDSAVRGILEVTR